MLTPVSFKKGIQAQPRLSTPYVPGKRHERYWTDDQVAIMQDFYSCQGAAYCLTKLPGKTLAAVYGQAAKMGLRYVPKGQATPRPRERLGDRLDETIKARWTLLKGRGAVDALAVELGVKRHALSQRALVLGLTTPHKKEPPWSPEEIALLAKAPVNNPNAAAKFFAAHGFTRSPAAIMVRCKRQGVSRRLKDVLSAGAAAAILGVDGKTMGIWCGQGLVVATRRGTNRLPQQGGDAWSIEPKALRHFIIEQLDRVDIRKVDKHAFVALLTGDSLDGPPLIEVSPLRDGATHV